MDVIRVAEINFLATSPPLSVNTSEQYVYFPCLGTYFHLCKIQVLSRVNSEAF